jgi:hypothetical protein
MDKEDKGMSNAEVRIPTGRVLLHLNRCEDLDAVYSAWKVFDGRTVVEFGEGFFMFQLRQDSILLEGVVSIVEKLREDSRVKGVHIEWRSPHSERT